MGRAPKPMKDHDDSKISLYSLIGLELQEPDYIVKCVTRPLFLGTPRNPF